MEQTDYQYRLLDFQFNDGTILRPDKLTVLIGPNNCGKSRALKDIAALTCKARPRNGVVVAGINVEYPVTLDELRKSYDVERYQEENGNWLFRSLDIALCDEYQIQSGPWPGYHEEQFTSRPPNFGGHFAEEFGCSVVAFLTTASRLQLVREGSSPSGHHQSSSLLQHLYNAGSGATRVVSDVVKQAFGKEVALDFTVLQNLLLRVDDEFSGMPADPRDALPLMQAKEKLDEQGDGIRSFVGIVVALLTLKRGLFLIDEPEAFLHPPQAFRIGALIADQSNQSRQIILATHSADVLRGILSRTNDVDIVRIDRARNANSFSHLDAQRLKDIVVDPLLSSARVLDGLFYSGVVVVEADSDARFYHAASIKRAPTLDLHFVNADNKQTVSRIVKLYREMGVRSAGIVDFDVLNDRSDLEKSLGFHDIEEPELSSLIQAQCQIDLAAGELPASDRLRDVNEKLAELQSQANAVATQSFASSHEEQHAIDTFLRQARNRLRELAEMTKPWKSLKRDGRVALPSAAQTAFDTISQACAKRGLFINPDGELESMLAQYGIPAKTDKKGWITQALQLIPNIEPDDTKNPWKFLKEVHDHLQRT